MREGDKEEGRSAVGKEVKERGRERKRGKSEGRKKEEGGGVRK